MRRMGERFLLIGAAGLVGRHLREALSPNEVVCTYRTPTTDGIQLDLVDPVATRSVVARTHPDVVILAAAEPNVERCEREPEATRKVNVEAASIIAEEARHSGAMFVVFSSEYVFDGALGTYDEADARSPLNEYGRQKLELEDIALGVNGLVCRTSGIFGLHPARKNFVCQVVDRLRAGSPFDVPADQLITPTYAPSLAGAVLDLSRRGSAGVFHVAGPRVLGRMEFARLIAKAYRLPTNLLNPRATSELPLVARRPLAAGLRVQKLRAALGYDLIDPAAGLNQLAANDGAG